MLMVSSTLNEGETGEGTGTPVVVVRRGGWGKEGTARFSGDEFSFGFVLSSGAVCERLGARFRLDGEGLCGGMVSAGGCLAMRDSSLGGRMYCPTFFGTGGISSP